MPMPMPMVYRKYFLRLKRHAYVSRTPVEAAKSKQSGKELTQ